MEEGKAVEVNEWILAMVEVAWPYWKKQLEELEGGEKNGK